MTIQTMTPATQSTTTPASALDELKQGNQRFVEARTHDRDLLAQAHQTATLGQHPRAIILGCVDSRVPVEVVFDQGIGDVFTSRVAGNVADSDTIGSMEFATALSGVPLIVVMGHTACGAVKGAIAGAQLGHLTGLLDKIKPAIAATPKGDSDDAEYAIRVARTHAERVSDEILERSETIGGLVAEGKVGIVSAMYDLASGRVTFGELRTGAQNDLPALNACA